MFQRKRERQVTDSESKKETQKRGSASYRQKASEAGNLVNGAWNRVRGFLSGTLLYVR